MARHKNSLVIITVCLNAGDNLGFGEDLMLDQYSLFLKTLVSQILGEKKQLKGRNNIV